MSALSNERPLSALALLREGFPLITHDDVLDLASDAPLEAAHEVSDRWLNRLPRPITDVATRFTDPHEVRVFALSSLAAASVALVNVRFFHRGRLYRPPLYLNVVGPAASGKGAARFALRLLHDVAPLFASGPPVVCEDGETRKPRLVLPADMSNAGLVGQLQANGGRVLIESSELDTLSGVQANQWSSLDALLRQGAEHEAIGATGKGGTTVIDDPDIAVLLTGTFDQFEVMFRSSENGLFSRFGFHVTAGERRWDPGMTDAEAEALHDALRHARAEIASVYGHLVDLESPVSLSLGAEEVALIDGVFDALVRWATEAELPDTYLSSVFRAAVIAKRYAAVVHALDAWSVRGPTSDHERLPRWAVEVGVYLALHHLDHSLRLLPLLPGRRTAVQGAMKRALQLLRRLGAEFERNEAVGVGEELGIAPRTVDSYLAKLRSSGHLRPGDRSGTYVKTARAGGRRSPYDPPDPDGQFDDDSWAGLTVG
ncbi:MAG: hypothetical protein CMM85_05500 [Rhodothermaceae bacterium]|nr:hypothetical protein [Rhodothermaceae bacterium]